MKTHGGWHIIQTWVFREDSEKVISNLRLTGQAENNHKPCEILKEEGRCGSGVLGRGLVHRHRERREHDTSWASNSKCRSTERLHVIRGLNEGSWRSANKFEVYSENTGNSERKKL